MRNYKFKEGDVVLHSTRSGMFIIDYIRDDGVPMIHQICTAMGKKRIGKCISGGNRCRPAQELVGNLQFIINKYSGGSTNR